MKEWTPFKIFLWILVGAMLATGYWVQAVMLALVIGFFTYLFWYLGEGRKGG